MEQEACSQGLSVPLKSRQGQNYLQGLAEGRALSLGWKPLGMALAAVFLGWSYALFWHLIGTRQMVREYSG